MKKLPDHLSAYKRTPVFNEQNVPSGLLNEHSTKSGVWAVIHIEEGELEYVIENDKTYVLTNKKPGIVESEVLHHIKPLGKVSFYLEFYQ